MSLGNNIQFLRKHKNMTQEQLAETLNVSRQSVSKWESDVTFPEMDKLLQICELLECSIDTMVYGNAEESLCEDTCAYNKHMNTFSISIAAGASIILLGIAALMLMYGLYINETICGMVFLIFVAASSVIFIVSGINHANFIKEHPFIAPFYKIDEIKKFNRRFPALIAIPVALILLGIIWCVGYNAFTIPEGLSEEQWSALYMAPFMIILAISVAMFIYAGIQKSKYNIEEYNQENSPSENIRAQKEKSGKYSGCIMLTATIIFLVLGFLFDMWDRAWVVYPIGGILCAIVSIVLSKNK